MFSVKVVETDSGKVVKCVECETERKAERVEAGILQNLNFYHYHTDIEEI